MDTYQMNTEIEQANDFLETAQIELHRPTELLERCRAIDLLFDRFDLSPLEPKGGDRYSAEFDRMQACIELARDIGQLVD